MLPALNADGPTIRGVLSVLIAGVVRDAPAGSVELEQPTQKPEIAALLLLGSAVRGLRAGGDLLSTNGGLERCRWHPSRWSRLPGAWLPLEAAFK